VEMSGVRLNECTADVNGLRSCGVKQKDETGVTRYDDDIPRRMYTVLMRAQRGGSFSFRLSISRGYEPCYFLLFVSLVLDICLYSCLISVFAVYILVSTVYMDTIYFVYILDYSLWLLG